jgi:hypothetical protein
MSLFHHISFQTVDPLGGGLREEIDAEQNDPEAIALDEAIDDEKLSNYWQDVGRDVENDPTWFRFDSEE